MQEELAQGMVAEGWRIDLCTASRKSPLDLSAYQLLVIGTPGYNRGVARPISAYLDRLGELRGMPVMIVVSGFNYTEGATRALHERIEQAHGQVVEELDLWTARPNRTRDGTTDPAEIMRRAGTRLARALPAAA